MQILGYLIKNLFKNLDFFGFNKNFEEILEYFDENFYFFNGKGDDHR